MPRPLQKVTQLLLRRSPARNSKRRKQRPPRKTRAVNKKAKTEDLKRLLKRLDLTNSTLGRLKSLEN